MIENLLLFGIQNVKFLLSPLSRHDHFCGFQDKLLTIIIIQTLLVPTVRDPGR